MKKFLALLFVFLMPFCFLFGCGDDSTAGTKTGLPYKNGILEYEYIVKSHSQLLAVIDFRISITETAPNNSKFIATFNYYDEVDKKEKFLYRSTRQFYPQDFELFEIVEISFYIPDDDFTTGKTVSSVFLELVVI